MNKILSIAAVFTLLALSSLARAADSPKQAIQKLYDSVSLGLMNRSVDAVMATRDDGYQYLDADRSVFMDSKDDERQRVEKLFTHSDSISDQETVQSVTMIGKDAVATVKKDYTRTQTMHPSGVVGKLHEQGLIHAFCVNHNGT